jgi:hypothetical protein
MGDMFYTLSRCFSVCCRVRFRSSPPQRPAGAASVSAPERESFNYYQKLPFPATAGRIFVLSFIFRF